MSETKITVEEVFHAALQIDSSSGRQRYLTDACGDDAALRHQVDLLLRANELADDFLEHPPCLAAADPEPVAGDQSDPDATQPPVRRWAPEAITDGEQLPRNFGDYELLEKVAHGGMGVVYKARQTSLNRIVAIKMILAGQFAGEDEVRRFYLEAEAAAHLDHPGIVPVFDVGCCYGQHFFSMGFVEGQSLADTVEQGPTPPRAAARHLKKIALAVQAAHDQGIIHRDLKPGNVLVDAAEEPRVTDFGLAKQVTSHSELTATGMVIGTPSYMPPEQASGQLEQIKSTSDVYSLGAILYALLTGRPPFEATTQIDTLIKVLHEEPCNPRQVVANIPRDLEAICLKCLEKKPTDRYATARDLADDLDHFLAGEPIGARNDLRRRFRKWTLREPVLAAHLVALGVMMTIILVNYLLLGHNQDSLQALWINEGLLASWAVIAIALQKTHNALASKRLIPVVWAALNPLLLTGALYLNSPPRELLFALYLLLVVTTGFFRRVDLVVATTASSLLGYVALLILSPNPDIFPSYKVVFAVTLIVTGVLLGFQVSRLRRICEKDVA